MSLILIIVFLLSLVLSGLFSGSETALFSLNKFRLQRMTKAGRGPQAVIEILQDPARLLVTILFGNLLVNVGLTSISTYVAIDLFGNEGVGIVIIGLSFILIVFGEVFPKNVAVNNPERFACRTAPLLIQIQKLLKPIVWLLLTLTSNLKSLFLRTDAIDEPLVTKEELEQIIHEGKVRGALQAEEELLISRILQFTETRVQTIMIPRRDIIAVPHHWSQQKFLEFLKKHRHSKIPVFHEQLDSIRGIVYAKDVIFSPADHFTALMKPAYYVPESKRIFELFEELRHHQRHMAIVVDEYGGTCGMVTMEDILEEIFGEIYDEYEVMHVPIRRIGNSRYRVDARLPIKDVNRALNLNLPQEDYDTLAGLILELFEDIPGVNSSAAYGMVSFTVERVVRNRILSVLVEIR